MMTSVLQLFSLLFLISSVYAATNGTVASLYPVNQVDEAKIVEAFNKSKFEAVDDLFYEHRNTANFQARIIEYAFTVAKNFVGIEKMVDSYYRCSFTYALINGNRKVVEAYLKYKVDCNAFIKWTGSHYPLTTLYDGSSFFNEYDLRTMTPLMVAVAQADVEMVRMLVTSTFKNKLDLLKTRENQKKVTARSFARKIKDYEKRSQILELLKIDPSKHDVTKSREKTLEDDELNVKHVLSNSNLRTTDHLETVLMMGNYADKNDESIMLAGVRTNNYLIIEMLVMEGYVIPDNLPNPDFTIMRNQDDYEIIMKIKDITKCVPHPRRFTRILTEYNEQCP